MTAVQANGNSKNKNGTVPKQTDETQGETRGKVDAKQIRAMFLKVFEFRESIAEKERLLKEEAKGASDLLKAILDATGGASGPYELDGQMYIIMSRTSEAKDEDGNVIMTKDAKGKDVPATHIQYYLRAPAKPPQVVKL